MRRKKNCNHTNEKSAKPNLAIARVLHEIVGPTGYGQASFLQFDEVLLDARLHLQRRPVAQRPGNLPEALHFHLGTN